MAYPYLSPAKRPGGAIKPPPKPPVSNHVRIIGFEDDEMKNQTARSIRRSAYVSRDGNSLQQSKRPASAVARPSSGYIRQPLVFESNWEDTPSVNSAAQLIEQFCNDTRGAENPSPVPAHVTHKTLNAGPKNDVERQNSPTNELKTQTNHHIKQSAPRPTLAESHTRLHTSSRGRHHTRPSSALPRYVGSPLYKDIGRPPQHEDRNNGTFVITKTQEDSFSIRYMLPTLTSSLSIYSNVDDSTYNNPQSSATGNVPMINGKGKMSRNSRMASQMSNQTSNQVPNQINYLNNSVSSESMSTIGLQTEQSTNFLRQKLDEANRRELMSETESQLLKAKNSELSNRVESLQEEMKRLRQKQYVTQPEPKKATDKSSRRITAKCTSDDERLTDPSNTFTADKPPYTTAAESESMSSAYSNPSSSVRRKAPEPSLHQLMDMLYELYNENEFLKFSILEGRPIEMNEVNEEKLKAEAASTAKLAGKACKCEQIISEIKQLLTNPDAKTAPFEALKAIETMVSRS